MRVLSTKFVVDADAAAHINRLEREEAARRLHSESERKCRELEGPVVKRDPLPPDPRWDKLTEVGL